MLEGFWGVLALVAIACLVALGLLWWIFTLPFHFLGFLLTGLGVALVVTFLVVAGIVALAGLALAGVLILVPMIVIPLLPAVMAMMLLWWLFFRKPHAKTA